MASLQVAATLKGIAQKAKTTNRHSFWTWRQSLVTKAKQKKEVVTRQDLAKVIAEQNDLTVAKSSRIIASLFDTISESVSQDKRVSIANFGTFESKRSSARTGRNPSTGEPLSIPAKDRPKFKAYTAFKEAVSK